jgi:hypothetical protein
MVTTAKSTTTGEMMETTSAPLVVDSAIGKKRINLLSSPITAAEDMTIRLTITHAIATPQIKFAGVFKPCATGSDAEEVATAEQ